MVTKTLSTSRNTGKHRACHELLCSAAVAGLGYTANAGGSSGLVLQPASSCATAGPRWAFVPSTRRLITCQGPPEGSNSMPPASWRMIAPAACSAPAAQGHHVVHQQHTSRHVLLAAVLCTKLRWRSMARRVQGTPPASPWQNNRCAAQGILAGPCHMQPL
jgi:hypothetical protein